MSTDALLARLDRVRQRAVPCGPSAFVFKPKAGGA
jgi:hypothetical protein